MKIKKSKKENINIKETDNNEKKEEKVSLLKLFLYFLKIGVFTFGGGYAIIAVLEKDIVEKYKWLSEKEMLDMMAVGESTPGALSLNMATFIGYKLRGYLGSILCTLAFILPSFTIISIISLFIEQFLQYKIVRWIFGGIRAGVIVLIANAFYSFLKKLDKSWFVILLFLASFFVALFTKINVIYIILVGGVLGLIYTVIVAHVKRGKNDLS